jgi:DedD protein
MAKTMIEEELQLKKRARRRLIGAVALVLLVVIFLPMFLASEPKPLNQDIAINIPPAPVEESAKSVLPPPSPPPLPAAPAVDSAPATPAVTSKEEVISEASGPVEPVPKIEAATKPATKPAVKPAVKPAPKPAAAIAPTAKPPSPIAQAESDAYLVQLGAFSNAENAKSLQKKLQDNRFKVHTELIQAPGGDRTRVRVGPYSSREAAEKARDRLKTLKLIVGDATVVRQGD